MNASRPASHIRAFALILTATAAGLANAGGLEVEANRMAETPFKAAKEHRDPFNEVELDVVFTAPDGKETRVPAFWAGGGIWKARFASSFVGQHTFRTECSDASDKGLHGKTGAIDVRPYAGDHPLYVHGPLRVAADGRHFEHADGTPFFWLGDTWWMGLCERLRWPDEFQTLVDDRREKGFNIVQIVAGLYPDMPAFDPRGRNEAGFPWEEDYARIRPEYFDMADRRMFELVENGMTPCVVGAWGYHLPWMGAERMKKHWRYVMARWGALPVVWCVAGEINLPWYLEKGFPHGGEAQTKAWQEIIEYVRTINGFGRLVTAHPTGLPPMSARMLYPKPGLLDFDMLQTGHGGREVFGPTRDALAKSLALSPKAPVLNSEVCYEALNGTIRDDVVRLMFWTNVLGGAAGHTYGANGVWQLNRKDAAYGASPHGGNYGTIPWDEAMKLPGAEQLGRAKKLLEGADWRRLTPAPGAARYEPRSSDPLEWGDWIWFDEGSPAVHAAAPVCFLRKTFTLPDAKVNHATFRISADDNATIYLNGIEIGATHDWSEVAEFADLSDRFKTGTNLLAIHCENGKSPPHPNPAGMNCSLQITLLNGEKIVVKSDATWRSSKEGERGWRFAAFDDSTWPRAARLAKFGEGPWGTQPRLDDGIEPICATIGEDALWVYAPASRPIVVPSRFSGSRFSAQAFDPVTGELQPAINAEDVHKIQTASSPFARGGDWLLIVTKMSRER